MVGPQTCATCFEQATPLELLLSGGELNLHFNETLPTYQRRMVEWPIALVPVQGLVQTVNVDPYSPQLPPLYQVPPPQPLPPAGEYIHLDGKRYRKHSDQQVYYVVPKGSLAACKRIAVASQLYNLFLPNSCIPCTVLRHHPVQGTPINTGDRNFIVKPEAAAWLSMNTVLRGRSPRCRIAFTASAATSTLLIGAGQNVQTGGLFTITQFFKIPPDHRKSLTDWDRQPQLVNDQGQPQHLVGLYALAVMAWALGDTDMHSENFGFVPTGQPNEWRIFIIDPSGALDDDAEAVKQEQLGRLPSCPAECFDDNGGWHVLGDRQLHTLPPDLGGVSMEGAVPEINRMLACIRQLSWQQNIAPIIADLDDEERGDWLADRIGRVRTLQDRH